MAESEWVKCPVCGWHWKRFHTGKHAIGKGEIKEGKGEFTFNKGNLETDAFISIRSIPGDRNNPENFREIDRISLEKAENTTEYEVLITSLKQKMQRIIKILKM